MQITESLKRESISDFMKVLIKVRGHGQKADFIHIDEEHGERIILKDEDIHEMSTEVAGGFVVNILGVYDSSCGKKSEHYIDIYESSILY